MDPQAGRDTDQAAVSSKRKRQENDVGEMAVKRERGGGEEKDGNQHMPSRNGGVAMRTMVCPITNAMFEEPVEASDGRMYSRHAILEWFASSNEQGKPITSPSTRLPMCEDLIPNLKLQAAVAEFKEEQAAKRVENVHHPAGPMPPIQLQLLADSSETVKSLADLGSMFSVLDGLRGLLAETLDGWQPPQLVVVGQESSGKSSVLGEESGADLP
jgi:hypothetical protein